MKLQQVLTLLCLAGIFVSVNSDSVAFKNIGMFQANVNTRLKTYHLSLHFRPHNWFEAATICKIFGMNLTTFDSLSEFQAVQNFLKLNMNLISNYVFVGGIANTGKSTSDWYWAETNKKIPFAMQWEASQPDFNGNDEWCLALGSRVKNNMQFNDLNCYTTQSFLCDLKT